MSPVIRVSPEAHQALKLTASITGKSEEEVVDDLLARTAGRPVVAGATRERASSRRARSGSQKEALRSMLADRYAVGDTFSLAEVYRHGLPLLQEMSPESQGLKPAIRRYLQEYRNDGMLDFLDRGQYRRIA